MKKPEILYKDEDILVCIKPAGMATQTGRVSEQDLYSLLKNELYRELRKQKTMQKTTPGACTGGGSEPYLAVIHRLDQPVSGLLVFARTKAAATELSRRLQKDGFHKEYLALTDRKPEIQQGMLTDWLIRDGRTNTSRVVPERTKDAKRAELFYEVTDRESLVSGLLLPAIRSDKMTGRAAGKMTGGVNPEEICIPEGAAPIYIRLKTGRHHQIRVQMAHAGYPLKGDTKYNPTAGKAGWEQIALCAFRLSFVHPTKKERMEFTICPEFLLK